MIHYDPTEARDSTRLPQAIIDAGHELPGLEAMTSADILITREPVPSRISEKMPPMMIRQFSKACRSGTLVQRKSGSDLLSSLKDLNIILFRMLGWTNEPWLVSTGALTEYNGMVVVDGRVSGVRWSYLSSRLTYWQRRGGYHIHLPNDKRMISWVSSWEEGWLDKPQTKMIRTAPQTLEAMGWYERLMVIPGIGQVMAKAIADWLPDDYKNVANALQFLSWADNLRSDDKPHGVGPKTAEAAREWLGLQDGEAIKVYNVEEECNDE